MGNHIYTNIISTVADILLTGHYGHVGITGQTVTVDMVLSFDRWIWQLRFLHGRVWGLIKFQSHTRLLHHMHPPVVDSRRHAWDWEWITNTRNKYSATSCCWTIHRFMRKFSMWTTAPPPLEDLHLPLRRNVKMEEAAFLFFFCSIFLCQTSDERNCGTWMDHHRSPARAVLNQDLYPLLQAWCIRVLDNPCCVSVGSLKNGSKNPPPWRLTGPRCVV